MCLFFLVGDVWECWISYRMYYHHRSPLTAVLEGMSPFMSAGHGLDLARQATAHFSKTIGKNYFACCAQDTRYGFPTRVDIAHPNIPHNNRFHERERVLRPSVVLGCCCSRESRLRARSCQCCEYRSATPPDQRLGRG